MNFNIVKTIYWKELRDVLRDRRTLIVMMVLPILLYPLLIIGFSMITAMQISKLEAQVSNIAVIGDVSWQTGAFLDTISGVSLEDTSNWENAIRDGDLQLAIQFSGGFDDSMRSGGTGEVSLFYNSSRETSREAVQKIERSLEAWKDHVVATRLQALNEDTTLLRPLAVKRENLATDEQKQGAELGRILGYLLIIMSLMGAFYPAIDLTAGEKERGTMETLLVSPAGRADIVYGKFFAIATIAMMTAILNVISIGFSILYVASLFAKREGAALPELAVDPASLVLALALIIPLILLFAAICMAIAVGARNYKEGQSLLTPLYSLIILPAMLSLVPGTELSPMLSAVPIVNISLLIKEYMTGNYLWKETAIAFASTAILAVLALSWAISQFKQESVLFRHSESVRWSPFRMKRSKAASRLALPEPGSVLLLIAIEIILLFGASAWLEHTNIARTIVISQLIILFPPLLLLYRGGYDAKHVLHLNRPRMAAWLATIIAICGGWIISLELATLQNMWMPFPKAFIDQFTKLFESLNQMPVWTALLLIAVLPAIVEETLCRGVILRSLLPRFGPTGAIVLSAVAFGILHLDPYRLLSTTFLGLLLGFIAWSTGSIFPAMLAHFSNNAISFLVQKYADKLPNYSWLESADMVFLPWYLVLGGLVLLILGSLWLRRLIRESRLSMAPYESTQPGVSVENDLPPLV